MMYCGATVIEEAESTCKVGGDVGSAVGRTVGGAVGISASGVAREGRILRHHPRIHMYGAKSRSLSIYLLILPPVGDAMQKIQVMQVSDAYY